MSDDSRALEQLATQVGEQLSARGWMAATAESCTGGWVAEAITAIAGSSAWFDRGFVTYSNDAKQDMLGVSGATLMNHGAVSEQTAREMAAGALRNSRAQIAVATTGVAGPAGGSATKPVGMVCFAWASVEGGVDSTTRVFAGDRAAVRRQSVQFALAGVGERTRRRVP